ncbi:MAG TPA: multicopper oxidase family protein [Candidatus Sulfotelmatobacter sp.]|nr:multicopper oxidase family protein [Candidatus Sulfotelmatobacter sp.]
MKNTISKTQLLLGLTIAFALLLTPAAYAAAPGITGPTFNLTAQAAYISQPDGQAVYSWGYGCSGAPAGYAPAAISSTFCNSMQIPGPTLIVTEGVPVTVNLTNNLPTSAGDTSILFPGFNVTTSCSATPVVGQPGLLTCEATPGNTVTYTFTPSSPGTRAYYSGTQGDLQVEMGLYGAIIVLPANPPSVCDGGVHASNVTAQAFWKESDFRLAHAAYDHAATCYDREYLFQFSEMDPNIHHQAQLQVAALGSCTAGAAGCSLNVPTEPYHPAYFMINGRSMPDDMDPNYAQQYPHQPYNGDPHMHPGEVTLLRIIGQGRWQHPFHEHGNHVRILARDGNLILSQSDPNSLAGPLLFTTTTTPGVAMDGLFYWTAKGLNWDAYGHNPASNDPLAKLTCTPDANGYNTGAPTAINYFEWCQDHEKPLQVAPFGDVAGGGPATLPDANIFTNGAWYGGSPYLGPNATVRATGCSAGSAAGSCGNTGTTPPSGTIANSPSGEAGFAFMWHSHNEREITTNNIFPGGMLMMMLVDSREFVIDETN